VFIAIIGTDFIAGKLKVDSFIRPNRIFTAHSKIIQSKKGNISKGKLNEVIDKLIEIIKT
jgi:mRNA interferase MazF